MWGPPGSHWSLLSPWTLPVKALQREGQPLRGCCPHPIQAVGALLGQAGLEGVFPPGRGNNPPPPTCMGVKVGCWLNSPKSCRKTVTCMSQDRAPPAPPFSCSLRSLAPSPPPPIFFTLDFSNKGF
ncbi:hypothetical protein DR999_PMT24015 [Platysternon megacephalum]|uniref:Uncharacterized protein n=1 Tax=Platysternon megacephalum TaxID=55544 RepID=A0A4D9DAQ0_9SAUR|nr:hypothetical protein DR999_PMT24015 [Platysternon megacephalum]